MTHGKACVCLAKLLYFPEPEMSYHFEGKGRVGEGFLILKQSVSRIGSLICSLNRKFRCLPFALFYCQDKKTTTRFSEMDGFFFHGGVVKKKG